MGITPFLSDDLDDKYLDPHSTTKWAKKVTATEILSLIEQKYDLLKGKLLQLMVRQFSGETTWEILPESERDELLDEVSRV